MSREELDETRAIAVTLARSTSCIAAQLIDGLAVSTCSFEAEGDAFAMARSMSNGIFLLLGSLKMAPTPDGITRRELIEAGKAELGEHLAACPPLHHPRLAEAWPT